VRVAAHACFDEEAGEMCAGDQLGVTHVLERTFVSILNTDFGQTRTDFLGTLPTPAACGLQACLHGAVEGLKAEAHDVNGFMREGDGDFGAGEVGHAVLVCGGSSSDLAADFIMVGQRPEFDTVFGCAFGQRFGLHGAVRDDAVAVQVGIEIGFFRHWCILVAAVQQCWLRVALADIPIYFVCRIAGLTA
jgi:hypothetical protein